MFIYFIYIISVLSYFNDWFRPNNKNTKQCPIILPKTLKNKFKQNKQE